MVTLIVTSATGCVDSVSQSLTFNSNPVADFSSGNPPYLIDQVLNLNDLSSGSVSWTWVFGDGLGVSSSQNPTYTYSTSGAYVIGLMVANSFGCVDSISREIIIKEELITVHPPKLPSAFTPNDDGNNDVLYVRGGPFTWVDFTIYNEWGEAIFKSNDETFGWDGTHKGEKASIGVYVYKVKGVTIDGMEYSKSGKIALIR